MGLHHVGERRAQKKSEIQLTTFETIKRLNWAAKSSSSLGLRSRISLEVLDVEKIDQSFSEVPPTSQTTGRPREGCEGDGGPAGSDVTAADWSRLIRPTALRPSGESLHGARRDVGRGLLTGPDRLIAGTGDTSEEGKEEDSVAYALRRGTW